MGINPYDDFREELERDFLWRRRELWEILKLVRHPPNPMVREGLLRAGVALLYAHWEGYVKVNGERYLQYVGRRRLRLSELAPSFAGLALATELLGDQGRDLCLLMARAASMVRDGANWRSRIAKKRFVDTKSNLTHGVLEAILEALGLDSQPYRLKQKLIDDRLLHARNNVAHGEEFFVEAEDFRELYDEVLGMLTDFRSQLDNAAILGAYRR